MPRYIEKCFDVRSSMVHHDGEGASPLAEKFLSDGGVCSYQLAPQALNSMNTHIVERCMYIQYSVHTATSSAQEKPGSRIQRSGSSIRGQRNARDIYLVATASFILPVHLGMTLAFF